jgi:phosphatidylglycerophosphate synthase
VKKTTIFQDFRNSLKNPWAEELVDLVFFRPVAFVCVKFFLYPLPITPNQVSFLAMAAGIASGILFAHGDRHFFLLGAVFYGIANILDCCDGMIARLKKNGTMTGRIVDGCIDYIIGIAVYLGFAIGLSRAVHSYGMLLPCGTWPLMILAGLSIIAHSIVTDRFRNAFLVQTRNPDVSDGNEFQKFREELTRLERLKGFFFDKTLIRIYLRYLLLQAGRSRGAARPTAAKLRLTSPAMVFLWNLIGPSTHVVFLLISACLYNPMPFFIFVIGAANLWMISLLMISRFLFKNGHY